MRITSTFFAALAFALSIAGAHHDARAESVLEMLAGLKFCRTLKADAERLKCFDGLISDKPNSRTQSTDNAEAVGTWSITESKSPLDDSPEVSAILQDTNGSGVLMLRCKEKSTDAAFKPATFLGSLTNG